MRHWIFMAGILATAFLTTTARSQVTGVPGINDYTINGSTSGSTSCTTVTIPFGSPITANVSAAPFSPVAIFVVAGPPGVACPCTPGFIPLPPSTCVGVQSIDIPWFTPGCITLLTFGTTDAAGNFSLTAASCPSGTRFSTQAVVFDPSCIPQRVWTQAYDVGCL